MDPNRGREIDSLRDRISEGGELEQEEASSLGSTRIYVEYLVECLTSRQMEADHHDVQRNLAEAVLNKLNRVDKSRKAFLDDAAKLLDKIAASYTEAQHLFDQAAKLREEALRTRKKEDLNIQAAKTEKKSDNANV